MNIKESFKNIAKYIGIGIVGGLAMFNTTNAQVKPEYNKSLTEIVQEGDNTIIPENKLNEFLKNYKPKQNQTLQKITDATKDGYITDALNKQPLEGIEASLWVIDGGTLIDTIGPTLTNSQGYYSFNITGIEDIITIENIGEIKYQIINTPQIQLNLNKLSKVEIKIYTILGEEIKTILDEETNNKTINTNIDNLASGVYILQTIIDGKPYNNKILKTENKYNYGKNIDKITKQTNKNNTLEKITELGIVRVFQDPKNQYHSYQHSNVEPYNNKTFNLTLPPIIPLQTPFNDPEVTYPINNLMDLWKDMSRIQGPDDYRLFAKTLYPLGIFTDPENTPTNWKQYITNAENIIRDSLDIPADSILKINNEYTEPDYNLGYSTINITYMDSTTFKNIVGANINAGGAFIFDNTNIAFTGFEIYLNTDKITNPIDAQKILLKMLQMYITQTQGKINNQNYLGNTTLLQTGPATTYNQDEKTQIKMIRNMTPNIWINRLFNPGTLGKQNSAFSFKMQENILNRFKGDKSVKIFVN